MKFVITKHRFIKPKEIDEESLFLRWDYQGYRRQNGYTKKEWVNTLVTKIGSCVNFLVEHYGIEFSDINTITASELTLVLFEQMPSLSISPNTYMVDDFIGILNNRYVVSLDREIDEPKIYLGTVLQPRMVAIFIDYLSEYD